MSDQTRWLRRKGGPGAPAPIPDASAVDPDVAARERLERYHEGFPERSARIGQHMQTMLGNSGVTKGRILEVGGRVNSYREYFPDFEYVCLDLDDGNGEDPSVIKGDITSCPELETGSFDAVISVNVLQHVRKPWLAVPEMIRLLRPGGFTYHSTVFSWRYQPSPVDYWRYTPDALMSLFEDLRVMRAEFDTVERRRNLIGKGRYRIDPDAFGGWRENWRVFYAGVTKE
jgi:SAM-dependent methyltransferase